MSCHLNLASVMETDFHSPGEDSHFSSLTSPLYDSSLIEDSESSLLGIIKDEFPYGSPVQCPSFWDTEPELNGSFDCSFELPQSTVSDSKEDFQKMLTDWQEHLGSLQASDNDDIEMTLSLGRQLLPQSYSSFGESLTPSIPLAEASSSSSISSNAGRSLLKPKEERLSNAAMYGMKVGGRDARLPIMEDSCGEDATSMLLTLAPSSSSGGPDLHNNSLPLQLDDDDDCIDIETVSEQNPVLEAGDLKSLLEQFEASEAVNSTTDKPEEAVSMAVHLGPSPTSLALVLSHQKIKEALPQEVIDKIRASSRKKIIPLIPAMPSKKMVRGTRMQDAAVTLNRNKLLKLVSGSAGDTVQLDHDYCTVPDTNTAVNFYHCDANDYSATREVLIKQEQPSVASPSMASISSPLQPSLVSPLGERRLQDLSTGDPSSSKASCWEKNAKKDSGLESGEVSDASEELPSPRVACPSPTPSSAQPLPSKKKLNLQEYRNRREELERQKVACQQSSTENSECGNSPREHSPPPLAVESALVPAKPQMHSVEVQTQEPMEIEQEKCPSRSRDQRSRRQHTRRSSGHGSTSSSSSGSSCSPHWQRHPPLQTQQQQGVRHRRRHRSRSSNAMHCLRPGTSDASSRSPSVSQSSSCSSPSRSRSRSRSRTNNRQYSYAGSTCSQRNLKLCNDLPGWNRRSCSPRSVSSGGSDWQLTERERQRQVEERRVIYVGRLPEGTTKSELRKRFEVFGPIIDISVHFREHGDNYGFVTFAYKVDAYDAVEHGNEDPTLPAYDLCFGGRRTFCKVRYSDLDAQAGGSRMKVARGVPISKQQESFDRLLQEAQAKLHKRNKL